MPRCSGSWYVRDAIQLGCDATSVLSRLDLVARMLLFDQCLKHSLGVIQPAIAFASGVERFWLIQDPVGLDALPLDVPSAWGDIPRHRDSQTTAITQVGEGLNQSFSKCVVSKQQRSSIVLECACQDFAGTCSSTVDKGHHRSAVQLPGPD